MIPPLDTQTGALPFRGAQPYWVDLAEVQSTFAVTPYRAHLWTMFEYWVSALDHAGFPGDLIIGGSFVTDKDLPSDIDVALAVEPDDMSQVKGMIKTHAALWTWQGVMALNSQEELTEITHRLQPMLGHIDAHPMSVGTARGDLFVEDWTSEFDGEGVPTGSRKGWIGVRRSA